MLTVIHVYLHLAHVVLCAIVVVVVVVGVSPGPVEGYLSISIVTKGNPATVNKVGI